jgi:deoxyribose-phosphate aldolase
LFAALEVNEWKSQMGAKLSGGVQIVERAIERALRVASRIDTSKALA